jgi:putative phage-type endonuclease
MSKRYDFIKAEQRSQAWHDLRRTGITATNAAVIAGLSPYQTPYQLWLYKTGRAVEPDAGDAARRGIILEDAVGQYYEQETGLRLRKSNGIVRLKGARSWVMASLDRTVIGDNSLIVEIKTSASPRWSLGAPAEVHAQVQWQLLCTGAAACDVVALLGGLKFTIQRIESDPKYQAELFARCEAWRERHILNDEMPALDGADSKALEMVTPQSSEEYATSDAPLDRIATLYAERLYESKLLDQDLANLAISIKEAIGDKAGIYSDAGWSASWRQNKNSRKVDWQQLAAEEGISADTVNAYTVETPGARVFKFKREDLGND